MAEEGVRSTDGRIDGGGVTERMQAERQEMEKEKGYRKEGVGE